MKQLREYLEGWEACEAGSYRDDNPYRDDLAGAAMRWAKGFDDRRNRGPDVFHLPRKL